MKTFLYFSGYFILSIALLSCSPKRLKDVYKNRFTLTVGNPQMGQLTPPSTLDQVGNLNSNFTYLSQSDAFTIASIEHFPKETEKTPNPVLILSIRTQTYTLLKATAPENSGLKLYLAEELKIQPENKPVNTKDNTKRYQLIISRTGELNAGSTINISLTAVKGTSTIERILKVIVKGDGLTP